MKQRLQIDTEATLTQLLRNEHQCSPCPQVRPQAL